VIRKAIRVGLTRRLKVITCSAMQFVLQHSQQIICIGAPEGYYTRELINPKSSQTPPNSVVINSPNLLVDTSFEAGPDHHS
jgi:hypothetical protein